MAAANALSPAERAQLLEALWQNVDPSDWPPLDDAWIAEVQRRSDLIDSGEMERLDWSEVRKKARREAGLA